jgi:hypothetical protein
MFPVAQGEAEWVRAICFAQVPRRPALLRELGNQIALTLPLRGSLPLPKGEGLYSGAFGKTGSPPRRRQGACAGFRFNGMPGVGWALEVSDGDRNKEGRRGAAR